ncbi:serine hydrolase domain-containing protein [Thalassotalea sp. G2M2-11]|uniref:serine hydrolase domain-containing protein n=1 Tax=Thalassotalea sp. G2M2-11 TaxID=2787627 RepID=UPI0019CFD4E7|nr:serine hydrolase domain-containing protein [Thalassotalea sp. G2M2-11]
MRTKSILLFAALCFVNCWASAVTINHNVIAKEMAFNLTKAINSNDYHEMLKFVEANITEGTIQRVGGAENYADYLTAESFFHGELQYKSIKEVSKGENSFRMDAFLHSKNTEFVYRVEMTISNQAPHKLSRMRLRAVPDINAPQIKPTTNEAISALTRYIERLGQHDVFSGAILLAKNNTILLEKSVGLASKRFNAPINSATRFNLGSMNKMFTAVTILRLVERGELSLSSPLHSLFNIKGKSPEFEKVQIQHLLSHTSGVGQLQCEKGEDSIIDSWENCLEKLSNISFNFSPGTNYRYSSDGMFIIGMIIEYITQSSYYDVLEEEVFNTAEMVGAECLDLQYPVKNAAIGYYYHGKKQQWRNNLFIHARKGDPAGGCYASANDLFKFASALTSNKLLNKHMTELAMTAKPKLGAENYGFGFIVRESNGQRIVGHNGSFPGVSSQLDMNLDSGYTLVVLSNHSFAADPIIAKFNQLF